MNKKTYWGIVYWIPLIIIVFSITIYGFIKEGIEEGVKGVAFLIGIGIAVLLMIKWFEYCMKKGR